MIGASLGVITRTPYALSLNTVLKPSRSYSNDSVCHGTEESKELTSCDALFDVDRFAGTTHTMAVCLATPICFSCG